jgi:diaminohydroxyphosphoribosylaminopyrimidine deaminase / 5-amino-6-(5-phosphoribosylamino)uracil reductase
MSMDELYMRRAIQLARNGKGKVAPNPLVGAVIVLNDQIIGEGYHEEFGGPHAEVNAVNSVSNPALLSESTIYITLEPCSHFGKTPPCADLLCEKHFKRVVIGSMDPNTLVAGKGLDRINNHGIQTKVGVLEKECRDLNKHFFTAHEKKRPFILLKWAESENGFIDDSGKRTKISNAESDFIVQQLRHEFQAILVGKNTVENDNPQLTCRIKEGSNPIRIVLDSQGNLNQAHAVFNDKAETLIINLKLESSQNSIRYIKVEDMQIATVLDKLNELGITSVLVEGGKRVHEAFLDAGLWDDALLIKSNTAIEIGTKAPIMNLLPVLTERIVSDTHYYFRNS